MSYTIQLVTAPTADTPGTTLMLQTPKQHYIFGSHSEGTQRAVTQAAARMTKVQDFFISGRTEWHNIGGLMGMVLTLADSATTAYLSAMEVWRSKNGPAKGLEAPSPPKLNVYGAPNLKHALATCRRFIFRKGLPIVVTEYKDIPTARDEQGRVLPTWQDANIKVWALSLKPTADSEQDEELAVRRASYERFGNHFEEFRAPKGESPEETESRYDRIRSAVMDFMFDSDWNFDTLVEHHISEVEMPTAMFVRNPTTHRIEPYVGPKPGGTEPLPDIKVLTRTPWPGAKVMALPPPKPALESVSYIVRAHNTRGAFNPKRAMELGIKKGPSFQRLANGESLQNDKGETITPDMVLGPEKPGQGIAILDIPTVDYLDAVLEREELQAAYIMDSIRAAFWILGPGVSGHPKLQQCMQKLNKLDHIISSVDNCPNKLGFESVAAQTTRLALVDPLRYSPPHFDQSSLPQRSLYSLGSKSQQESLPNAEKAERGSGFTLMPTFAARSRNDMTPAFDLDAIKATVDPEILSLADVAQQSVHNNHDALTAWQQLLARPDTEVVSLGTGSALPSKYRNVSATLVKVPGIGNYLFDCGENTLGQLQRVFNPDEVIEIIKNLRVIWISHLHADHHLGTASMIKMWYTLVHNNVPGGAHPTSSSSLIENASAYGLSVISHEGMLKWLWEYSAVEDFGYSRMLPVEIQPVRPGDSSGSTLKLLVGNYNPQLFAASYFDLDPATYGPLFGLADIQACAVRHCHGAMAVSLTFPRCPSDPETVTPLKISYSGDCRPSQPFTLIGRDTTVLIHEATFDDELRGDAKAKKHSTTSEALGIGAAMGAKAVLLTHFSQRYQKIPVLQPAQDDELDGFSTTEDVQLEDDDDVDADVDDMDAPTDAAATAPTTAPAQLHHQPTSANDFERVIRVKTRDMKVGICFDYMRVRIGDIAQLERFNAALEKLLVVEEDEQEGVGAAVNANGKKMSGDEGGAASKKKKSKRNN